MCVFSPFFDGNPVHDDGVGDFDLLFHGCGTSYGRPLYGSLIGHLAHRSDDTVGPHLRAVKSHHHGEIQHKGVIARSSSKSSCDT